MSDYDTVLERLVTDPTFVRALSADPDRALVGYALTDDERRILTAGISTDDGRTSTVEQRTTKAGLVGVAGLVAELASAMGGSGSGGLLGSEDRIPNFVHTTPQGAGGGQPVTGLTGLPGGVADPLGDADGDGVLNVVDPSPQGGGGGLPGGWPGDMFGDDDGDGIPNFIDPTPQGAGGGQPVTGLTGLPGGDATIVEFRQGAIHDPVVVGQLYGDHTAPPPEAGNPLFSTAPIPTADQSVVENPSPRGQGQGLGEGHEHGDDKGRGHADKTDPARPHDPPPSRR